jgi:phosphoribosylformylglycinamidine synthase subunit PurQ / glutaminase
LKPVGIIRFLGTNCDADVVSACLDIRIPHRYVWWADRFKIEDYSAFILPGGFSYGDYLRCGAMAARAPAMDDVREGARKGYPVLGICNGFQILCEAGLLPGVLTKNISRQFQDEWAELEQTRDSTTFWGGHVKSYLKLPIAHSMGRYFAPPEVLDNLFEKNQVWLTYRKNPNGSLKDIAGITNEKGNVAALMPHPERAMHEWMGSRDGRALFEVLNHVS